MLPAAKGTRAPYGIIIEGVLAAEARCNGPPNG